MDLLLISFLGGNSCVSHGLNIIFLILGIQFALATRFVVTVWNLAEMAVHISLQVVQWLAADIAHFRATGARHLVTAIRLDKFLFALGAGSHFGLAEGLLNLETALISTGLFRDLLTPQRNVRLFATFSTRDKVTAFDGALENVLCLRNLGLIATFGAHGQVSSQSSLLDLGLGLHFRILFPGFGWQCIFQQLLAKA